MEILARTGAILIEIAILSAIMFSLLAGVRLIAFDVGLKSKYRPMFTVALAAAGIVALVFFIVHLTAFYPTVAG